MVKILLSLLCNLSYGMQSPSILNGGGAKNFLNEIKKVGTEQLLGEMSFSFLRNTIFPKKLEFNKK